MFAVRFRECGIVDVYRGAQKGQFDKVKKFQVGIHYLSIQLKAENWLEHCEVAGSVPTRLH